MTIYECDTCTVEDGEKCILDTVEDMSDYPPPKHCPYEASNEPEWVEQKD